MIVHYVPAETPRVEQNLVIVLFLLSNNMSEQKERKFRFLTLMTEDRVLLGCADIDGSFQLLFAVALKVHEL